ncbi:multiple epidermal growth factor-like domains protein 10 [Haliotis rufescens]|uniref:multiple epidermal growth factor-like domains protein 10 n=1 Tax=Haliotis rufescens TaxID=6454 RepID=UPI00201F092A|nr:multiple epidermal growth factor-like domains protein 10 [Haliotis rufescens]
MCYLRPTEACKEPQVKEHVKRFVMEAFYVDNCLDSVPTSEDARALLHDIGNLLDDGGFHVRQLTSNDASVVQDVPSEDRSDSCEMWLNRAGEDQSERTLGEQCKDNQHCSDCDRSTGRCLTDCDTGYFDRKCRSMCNKNCRNRSRQLSSSGSGACTEGCVPGYQGPGCSIRCGSPGGTCVACPGGCDGGYCQLGSSCVSGCVDSYYGTDCKTCSSRCKSCNRMTGLCKECRPGYFGPNCAYFCDHCLGSCAHGCAEGCLPGFYGTFCDKKCSEQCGLDSNISTSKPLQTSKAGLRDCQRDSGDCIDGCEEGWHGQQCSSPCSPNCINKRCKSTGDCVDGCVPGHFGRDCKPCPVNCLHNMCHSDSGKCTDGCTRGFYGGLCQYTCEVCLDGVCDQKTGTCTIGCHLTGPKCDSTCTFNCSVAECLKVEHCNQEDTSGIQIATLSTSLILLVVGSMVSVGICCRKRVAMPREGPQERELDDKQVPQPGDNEEPESEKIYHEIDAKEMGPEIVFL